MATKTELRKQVTQEFLTFLTNVGTTNIDTDGDTGGRISFHYPMPSGEMVVGEYSRSQMRVALLDYNSDSRIRELEDSLNKILQYMKELKGL